MSNESECEYVSSWGILKSCKFFNKKTYLNPGNSYIDRTFIEFEDFNTVKEGDIFYISTYALRFFAIKVLPFLKCRIILVSGDSDDSIGKENPDATIKILESPLIIQWFSQNCLINHHKLTHLPIGLDYHTMANQKTFWGDIKNPKEQESEVKGLINSKNFKPFWERNGKIYSTFHFCLERGDRREAFNDIPKNLIDYETNQISRIETHKKQINYAFIASPFGGGPDCHRTWEALILGCIPIIKSSGIDLLFKDLPVLLVEKWSDVTQALLDKTIEEFKSKNFNYKKLTLKYWMNLINSYKPINENIVICALAKNVEKYLEKSFNNIMKIANRFEDYRIIFVENDSTDNTRKMLQYYARNNNKIILKTFDNLYNHTIQYREQVIAFCRNVCIEEVKRIGEFEEYNSIPYTLMVDIDEVLTSDKFTFEGVYSNIKIMNENDKIGALSAVVDGTYYDIYALRNEECNYNCWEMVRFKRGDLSYEDAVKKFVNSHGKDYSKYKNLIPVDSAFGGATMYRNSIWTKCKYEGIKNNLFVCEHVSVNQGIKEAGYEIYLNPKFIIF
jgi:hypothetical protein